MAVISDDEDRVDAAQSGAPTIAPRPSAAQRLGGAARAVTGAGASPLPTSPTGVIGAVDTAVRAATRPLRQAGRSALRDFGAGLAGESRPRPDFAGVGSRSTSSATGAAPDLSNARAPRTSSNVNIISPTRPDSFHNGPPLKPRPKAGDVNTFTGSDGITRRVADAGPTAAAPIAARPLPVTAQRVAPVANAGAGAQGAVIGGPADEAQRRLENALATVGRGSPSVRRALMEQFGTQQQREFEGGQNALDRTQEAALQANQTAAAASAADARNRLDADMFNQELQSAERIARRPTLRPTAEGLGMIAENGRYTPVTDADGRQIRDAGGGDALTGADLLKAYSDQRAAIMQGLGDEAQKQAALQQLDADPLFAQLRGGQGGEAPPVAGAQRAPDGEWYVQNDDGSFSKVVQ